MIIHHIYVDIRTNIGSLFSKTWRIYKIFKNPRLNKKTLSDVELFGVVAVLLGLHLIIVAVWLVGPYVAPEYIDPFHVTVDTVQTNPTDDLLIYTEIQRCVSQSSGIFLAALLGLQVRVSLVEDIFLSKTMVTFVSSQF